MVHDLGAEPGHGYMSWGGSAELLRLSAPD